MRRFSHILAFGLLALGAAVAPPANAGSSAAKVSARPTSKVPKKITARPQPAAGVTAARPKRELTLTRPTINASKVKSQVERTRLADVHAARGSRFAGASKLKDQVRTSVGREVRTANSGTLKSLDKVMPGFHSRGVGAARLRDMAGDKGNHRNPVTNGQSMSNFSGGRRGQFQSGSGVLDAHKDKQGRIIIVKDNGDIITRYPNGDRQVDKANGDREFHFAERKVHGIPAPPIEPLSPEGDKSKGKTKDGKQGSQKEPTQDDTGSSGQPVLDSAQLRGLAARLGAAGTPTGDEPGSGGPVDETKTRDGRRNAVGQPTGELVDRPVADALHIRQIERLRVRRIIPVQQ
jgi:hypothetical protein